MNVLLEINCSGTHPIISDLYEHVQFNFLNREYMNTTNDQAEIPEVTIPEALIAVRARILASLNFPTLF